jgi:pilus assembly protein Flp/PilA
MKKLMRFLKDEEGVTAVEYGLIAALISVGIIVATQTIGGKVSTAFQTIADALPGGEAPAGE